MTRKIKRHQDFQVVLEITNDDFVRPPREAQRNWLLNRAVWELTSDLEHLNRVTPDFIPGAAQAVDLLDDRTSRSVSDQEIMEDWQIPIMERMASIAAAGHGDVLEIGFGRGVASDFIQELGVSSHTIVECNGHVVDRCREWIEGYPDADIMLLEGRWQDLTHRFGTYDAILFHACPLNAFEHAELVANSATFAGHFFPTAADHLCAGGSLTYLTNEYDSLSRAHQRLLFEHFSAFTLSKLQPLRIPPDSKDMLWGDSIVIIDAVK